jgi:small-conductance mechanosensitive channel
MDFQTIFQNWLASFFDYLPKLIAGLVIFIVTVVGSSFFAKWVVGLVSKKIESKELHRLIFLITRWSVLIVGTIMALDQVNFDVTGFIAGLGVAGFTIGFALQDIAKNFISGLLLLYRQPFNLGDMIQVADFQGVVKEINIRDTVVQTVDGELVIIPNQTVFSNPIVNFSDTNLRRRRVEIGLGYDEDADAAMSLFLDAISAVPGVEKDPEPTIQAEALGDSTLTISVLFWVDQQKNNLLTVHSEVVKAIKTASETHHINLPYPIQKFLIQQTDQE